MLKIQMFIHKLMNPLANREGATAIEYALMAALIALAMAGGAQLLGNGLDDLFTKIGNELGTATVPVIP